MTEQIIEQVVEGATELGQSEAVEAVTELAPEVVSKLPNKKLLFGLGLGAVAIGLGGYILYQRHKNGKSKDTELSKKEEAIDVEYEERED